MVVMMNSDDILKNLRLAFPSVPQSVLQEKALELVFNQNITEQQVIEDIRRQSRRLNNKISVTSFDQTVNLADCDPSVAQKITTTLEYFRKMKGWVCDSSGTVEQWPSRHVKQSRHHFWSETLHCD